MSNKVQAVFTSQVFPEGATNSSVFTNTQFKGAKFVIDNTAEAGTSPTITLKLQAKNAGGLAAFVDVAGVVTTALAAQATTELTVYPGIAETANISVSDVLPVLWRVVATVGGTDTPTVTASVYAHLIE